MTLTALVVVIPVVIASPQADASVLATSGNSGATVRSDDHGPINLTVGNGNRNKNDLRVVNTTTQHGVQNLSTTNLSGTTRIQNSSCKNRHRACNVYQRQRTSHRW
ncbi:hypothetical protein AB0O34_05135 [Sphaerisporangium sp. NPDC088356]|uniref:hypothetical protein n=1 Tax=Sphaerisporangium sp. NPDC088356 TaxID=3154871 RepID=UPI00341FB43E